MGLAERTGKRTYKLCDVNLVPSPKRSTVDSTWFAPSAAGSATCHFGRMLLVPA
jgi:hypothetical protein